MSRTPRLTDALIRAAFAPPPDLAAPPELLGSIEAEIRRARQVRVLSSVPGLAELAWVLGMRQTRRLAWVLATLALVLALAAGALVGARLLQQRSLLTLVPTGVETLTPEAGVVERVVVDGVGVLWALGPGYLTRFDPDGAGRRTWTVSDDAAFAGVAAPARAGGVWIWWGSTIRRFADGAFLEAIPAWSSAAVSLVEAPDGSLWAAASGLGLRRWDGAGWDGAGWLALHEGPASVVDAFLARATDDVWVASHLGGDDTEPRSLGLRISHLVGGRWINYDASDAPSLGGHVGSIDEAADGSIWVAAQLGIARFDGRTWSVIDGPGFAPSWLEAAPDGSVWAGSDKPDEVACYLDGRWTRYGRSSGLAGTVSGRVSATPAGVFLATDAGLFRFAADRWVAVWPATRSPGGSPRLVAVSADEAWAADIGGLWHYDDGAWTGPLLPDPPAEWARNLAVGADGLVWLVTDAGVAVFRDGRWTTAWTGRVRAIDVGRDGTAWIAGEGDELVGLRMVGDRVETRTIACPVSATSLAVATDGSVYLGHFLYGGDFGLARFDGRTCAMLNPLGGDEPPEVFALVADPRGGAVAILRDLRANSGLRALVRLDAGRATILRELADVGRLLAVDQSGGIWRAIGDPGRGLERYDGHAWTVLVADVEVNGSISIAPDGTVWFGGPSGIQRLPAP